MWHYLDNEDMTTWVKKTNKELYWKLSNQARARIPMLKEIYIKLKKKYE
jgi:hypothetical protein